MEATLYNDEPTQSQSIVKQLKRTMTLDFNGPTGQTKKQKIQSAVLQSPDLNMLKLASPELERMIIQANGMVTTTPTPTQFLFPKTVTEEQEAYAQGFVAALAELHNGTLKNVPISSAVNSLNNTLSRQLNGVNFTYTAPESVTQTFTTTTSLPGGILSLSDNSNIPTTLHGKLGLNSRSMSPLSVVTKIKEEPQTVPCGVNSPPAPVSPIDMEDQERIKLERKRARNRVAARKCRTRKLERIARLEDKLKDLKNQNNDLADAASKLREEVCALKKTIIEHVNGGCQIMMTSNLSF